MSIRVHIGRTILAAAGPAESLRVSAILKAAGHTVIACDGQHAVADLLQVVIMDVVIAEASPLGGDGIGLAREVRAQGGIFQPSILLLVDDRAAEAPARAAGADACVLRPFSPEGLVSAVDRLLRQAPVRFFAAPPGAVATPGQDAGAPHPRLLEV